MRLVYMKVSRILFVIVLFSFVACRENRHPDKTPLNDTTDNTEVELDTPFSAESLPPSASVDTRDVAATDVVKYAKTLIGTPYKYGSIKPQEGFDCSGFITHVFNHFNIAVPRSSKDFEHVGTEINVENSKPGDLILFTGTDSTDRTIGHMGIITANNDSTLFIHSTSGKAYGVTITPLNAYYQGRFVKTVRIFK